MLPSLSLNIKFYNPYIFATIDARNRWYFKPDYLVEQHSEFEISKVNTLYDIVLQTCRD